MEKFYQKFNLLLFILSVSDLIFVILMPKIPFLPVSGSFISIRIEDISTAIVFAYFFIYLILSKKYKVLLKDDLYKIIATFLFIGLVSLISGFFLTHTVTLNLGLLHYFRRVEYIFFLPLLYISVNNLKRFKLFLVSFGLVVFIVALYALGQQYSHFPIYSTTTSELSKGTVIYVDQFTRVNSTFAGHYDLGVFMLFSLVILCSLFFYFFPKISFKKIDINHKIINLILISSLLAISIFILVLTGERIAFVSAIFAAIFVFLLLGKRLAILVVSVLALLIIIYPSPLRERLISTYNVMFKSSITTYVAHTDQEKQKSQINIPTLKTGLDSPIYKITTPNGVLPDVVQGEPTDPNQLVVARSIAIRLNQEWPRAIRSFLKNPLLGTGYSSIGVASDNDYLRSLAEVGLLGTFSFALIIVVILKRVWKGYKSKDKFEHFLGAGVFATIAAVLLNAFFTDIFEASKIAILFWGFMGAMLSFIQIKREESK